MGIREVGAWIVVGILILSLGLGAYKYFSDTEALSKEVNKIQYWETEGFKTMVDSIGKTYSKVLDSRPTHIITVPEKIIERFDRESPLNRQLILGKDSLIQVVDSLNKVISKIDTDFLTNYPQNPKLIWGSFSIDTLKFDLLNTDGLISSHLWIADYSRYKYTWSQGSLTTVRLPTKIPKKKFISLLQHHLYTHIGYEIPLQAGYIQGAYYLSWKNITFATQLGVTLQRTPTLEAKVGLGYKIL